MLVDRADWLKVQDSDTSIGMRSITKTIDDSNIDQILVFSTRTTGIKKQ